MAEMEGVVEASIEEHAVPIEREVVEMTMPDVIGRCVEDETALHVGQGVYGDDEIDPQGALVVKVCALIDKIAKALSLKTSFLLINISSKKI